mmetsp:Transcript_22384/g.54429  ORF Transcript_22384/g.54429 Transcript_22384/m.54429 type:complete len:327 (+) Transcript_22384:121-1101(+)
MAGLGLGALLGAIDRLSLYTGASNRVSSAREELQEAVRYGKKERANPGRDATPRLKFTHKGVIYVTDLTGKHLITSWRMRDLDDLEQAQLSSDAGGVTGSHTVIVVDASGSMRKGDVPGYESRTEAVYDCVARDFLTPQLQGPSAGENLVSLLEMSDETSVVFKRAPVGQELKRVFEQRGRSRAKSHGNYIPMLDAVTDILMPETHTQRQILIMILSDGAPSDHLDRVCAHGTAIWQEASGGGTFRGKKALRNCPWGNALCRQSVMKSVRSDCVQKVVRVGDIFGRDRTTVVTAAFGPPSDLPQRTFRRCRRWRARSQRAPFRSSV